MPAERIAPASSDSLPKFWTAIVCPFAQNVAICLKEKDVEYEHIEVDLTNKPDEFLRVNPAGKVPVIQDGNHTLLESSVLMEYVEETWSNPEKRLMPEDTVARARIRLLCNKVSELAIGPFYKCLFSQDEEERNELFQKLMDNYEKLISDFDKDGPFIMGNEFTLADIKLAPFRRRLIVLETLYNFQLPDNEDFQRLSKWWAAVQERPSFAATNPTDEYLTEKYGKYAKKSNATKA